MQSVVVMVVVSGEKERSREIGGQVVVLDLVL